MRMELILGINSSIVKKFCFDKGDLKPVRLQIKRISRAGFTKNVEISTL